MTNSNTLSSVKSRSLAALLGASLLISSSVVAFAQSVSTVPVGAVNVTIAAGTGAVKNATVVSFPLINSNVPAGISTGAISSLTANTLSSTGAGWVVSSLAQSSTPFLVKIISGAASGRTFIVSANTTDSLTISTSDGVSGTPVSLVSLGVVAGDRFQIEDADTLVSLFGIGDSSGASAPLGGSNPNLVDTIQINTSNSYQTFYYDLSQQSWVNVASEALANNVIVRPDTAVIYNRIKNTPLTITLTGSIPSVGRMSIIRSGQNTIISNYWPVDSTLGSLSLNNLPGWVSSANPSVADVIQMRIGSSWRSFFHDGSNWIDLASEAVSDNVSVSVGSGLIIKKKAISSDAIVYSKARPYSL